MSANGSPSIGDLLAGHILALEADREATAQRLAEIDTELRRRRLAQQALAAALQGGPRAVNRRAAILREINARKGPLRPRDIRNALVAQGIEFRGPNYVATEMRALSLAGHIVALGDGKYAPLPHQPLPAPPGGEG